MTVALLEGEQGASSKRWIVVVLMPKVSIPQQEIPSPKKHDFQIPNNFFIRGSQVCPAQCPRSILLKRKLPVFLLVLSVHLK